MSIKECDFEHLACRVRRGDPGAPEQLYHELRPQLVYMVRQTLRSGKGSTPIRKKILAQARQVALTICRPDLDALERLIDEVAGRVCEDVVDNVANAAHPGQALLDTVANA